MCRESDLVGHFRDVYLVVDQQEGSLLESDRLDKIAGGDIHYLLQLSV